MESLSIPPHRRKHSPVTNVFSSSSASSLNNPYDDVLLSKGGSTKNSFGAQEYAEIFSGSSSIPVLDLSALEDRVGLGNYRSSDRVDYSNIFGGLRNDDMAVPYEELFNASAKTMKQRISADDWSPSQESGSLHSSGRTKRSSGDESDQSINDIKQQFNLSFNKTSQNNDDASNGKTHIAQFHAVPGFTYFVDRIPQPQKKTEGDRPIHSLKREVSRTWSFSAEVDAFNKGKGGLSRDKINAPEKFDNVNELNLKSQPSKVPSSDRPSDLTNKADPRLSKVSSVASREYASGKTDGENSLPLLDEELDENSVAAVSAAALKKAIEQARESIRLAKMIMEGKREGLRNGTKQMSKSVSKVKDMKKSRIDREAVNYLKEGISTGDCERSNIIITGVDKKFAKSVSHSDPLIIVRRAEVERAMENVEMAKEHREEFIGVDTKFAPSCSLKETLRFSEKVGLEKHEEKVEAVEACKEAAKVPGFVAHVESRDPNLMSRLVENINLMLFRNKPTSTVEKMETGNEKMEQIEKALHHEIKSDGVAALRNSNKNPEMYRSMVDTLYHPEGPENVIAMVARDPHTSPVSRDQINIVDEEYEILRIGQEDRLMEENEHAGDELNNEFQQHEDTVNQEEMMVLRSEIQILMNGSGVEHEDIKHKTASVDECNENDHKHGRCFDMEDNVMNQKEAHQYFETGSLLKENMDEELNKREPETFPEIENVEMKDNHAHEPENDNENSHIFDGDRQNFPGEVEQIDEGYVNNFAFEGTETIEMESDNLPEVQKNDVLQDEEMNNDHGTAGKGEENQSQHEFQKAVYDKDTVEDVDASSSDVRSVFSEHHLEDTSTTFCETQESSDFDLNDRTEEDHKTYRSYKENVTVPEVPKTFSGVYEFTEMPLTHDWRLCDSEENIDGSNLQKNREGPSENMKEYFGSLKADIEDKLSKDQHTLETSGEIHDVGEACAAAPQKQTLPEFSSDYKKAEIDLTYARHVFEQTLGSDEEGLSAHESQECTHIPKDETLNKDEIKADVGLTSNEHGEERSDAVYSELDSEPKKMEKSMESEGDEITGQTIEKNKENPTRTPSTEQKDAKGNVQNFDKDDHRQRIEAIKKGREREKDRIAVERAIREARERAFADARERAERAAVERAAAEARQRAIAEAREKLEKASMAAKKPVDRASTEAKIRAERAAVDRATAEARERALEKARSQKTSAEARTQTDRSTAERFTSSSRNNGLKHSFSSSDLEGVDGSNAESAQRRKARLERHQRIMERAANALAEKNMRDLIAQKEQAERNRLAESLDADIKRWATGKEGNLRALLSTLQYILGPNSGWQPISLTEIITTAAVKKAYRKATLYVHPDKLQQRGANIQQKYICEKVFDMLKAAWNRFNSEER